MATREQIEEAVDRLANEAEEAWAKNGDMMESAIERLDIEPRDLMERVANELTARFDY